MNFLAPLFLLGALAVAAPVVFHLIRRTTREVSLTQAGEIFHERTRLIGDEIAKAAQAARGAAEKVETTKANSASEPPMKRVAKIARFHEATWKRSLAKRLMYGSMPANS